MCDGNYIKLSRKLLEWEWYQDGKTARVFIHCLLKANWKDGRFKGIDVPRGSFISSYGNLAVELGMSVQSVRTSINHLISTSELTSKGYSQFSIFTVVKYNDYQEPNKETNIQLTSNQQATNNNRRKKEGKKERIIHSDIPELNSALLDFIEYRKKIKAPMTDRAIQLLINKLNKLSSNTSEQIEILNQSVLNGWKGIYELKKVNKQQKPQQSKNKFNNFNQRDYDYDDLEKQLLQNNKLAGGN